MADQTGNSAEEAHHCSHSGKDGIRSMTYYQKPTIGNDGGVRSMPPIELVFPNSGGILLGVPARDPNSPANNSAPGGTGGQYTVLASGPERLPADVLQLRALKITFLIVALVNIIVSSLLFTYAYKADTTLVTPGNTEQARIFQEVPRERRHVENVNFAFVILIIVGGSLSVIFESAVGVSAYCLATLLNFLLGVAAVPSFVFSFRFVLDMFMLYFALVYRSRIMYTFLPLHLHTQ